jgi:YYY domain-containing protein
MTDVFLWYLWMQAFAFAGWLVARPWLSNLPDRGYGISKALGILLGGFAYWLIVTLGLSPNGPGAVLFALILVALAGLGLRYVKRQTSNVNRPPSSALIATELLFALAFLACAVYRAYNPDIIEAGGEKFMESMYLNAIARSPSFPPNDAWLSGFSISYYYFGYIIMAMLKVISGVKSAIAFNLSGAMFFGLALTSAFSAGYNIWGAFTHVRRASSTATISETSIVNPKSKILAGLLTALMLGVMGNMGGFMEAARCAGVFPQSFWVWLDVREIAAQPIECNGLAPTRFYWWWDWSRVIHDYTPTGANQEVITETPAFSYILGDNHPHVMSLPFVLLAVTLALHFLTQPKTDTAGGDHGGDPAAAPRTFRSRLAPDGLPPLKWLAGHAPDLILASIVVGGLSFMNTWDFPVYGALIAGAILLRRRHLRLSLWPGLLFTALMFALGYALYLPFYATFASQARGIGVNLFNGTRFAQFFLMFAPFVVAAPLFIVMVAKARGIAARRVLAPAAGLLVVGVLGAVLAMLAFGLISPQGRAYAQELASTGAVMGVTRDAVGQRLLDRLADPWTPLFLLTLAALCATLIVTAPRVSLPDDMPPLSVVRRPSSLVNSFVLLLFLGGALLTVAVEFIFLQDLFGTRMNTVFKFYYQAWTVWALAGAFALMTFIDSRGVIAAIATTLVGALLLAGLLFPIFAAASKTNDFSAAPTLDGAAYLQRNRPDDARMIDWLNQNVTGAPTIAEAPADKYGAYSFNGRISAFTGLPTLLGWGGHEHQWRGNYDEPARREPQIETLYNSTDPEAARKVLQQYDVRYVIVGQQERARYTAEGLAKFDTLCAVAFKSGNSAIYACNP